MKEDKKISFNEWADFWRYEMGANVIPANTPEKLVTISWKPWQNNPIPEEQHVKWKNQRAFNQGMAIFAGQVWHNQKKKGLHLILVDLDNQKAIDELCSILNSSLKEISKRMIIEQHKDQRNKAHVIFYATHPFPKKGSSVAKLLDELKHEEIPAIEIKGSGENGLLFCSPSPHKNGYNYEIIGTREPQTIDEMEKHLQDIFRKHGIQYPSSSNDDNEKAINDDRIPIKDFFKPGIKIYAGQNRHEALMRVMESLLLRNQKILDENTIRGLAEKWNNDVCEPPLDAKEFSKQWKSSVKFIDLINKQRAKEQFELDQRRKREQVEEELAKSEGREIEKKNPLRIGVLARLNEEGINHFGYGQLSSLSALYKRVRSAILKCDTCWRQKEIVFDHPQTYLNFHEKVGFGGSCKYRFIDDFNSCDGWVKTEPQWVNALDIEVSDTSSLQDIDRLKCVLLADDTENVGIGEDVIVFGAIYMEQNKRGPTFPVDYVQSVKYEGREQEELTKLDIEGIKRFREKFPDDEEYIKKLVSMIACNVIGLEEIKEGILYMVARAKPDRPDKRERIHGIIISIPGMAKTALLNYTTELMERSTFETAQLSTGLSLIVIVENSGDMKILRLGPVSTSMLACIDEFNRLSGSDQEKFFGVMEEGRTTTVKFGRKVKITAPVTILASINPPEGSDYDSEGRIDLQSMDIIAPILSRFDLKFYIPPLKNDDEIRKLVNAKADLETRVFGAPNYSKFLKKVMVYIKQYYPNPKLTDEALSVINEAYLELKKQDTTNAISPRVYNLLANLARARAMLLLKKTVDSEIAQSVVKYYSETIKAYQTGTIEPKDPIQVAIQECRNFLDEKFGQDRIEYIESDLLKKVCESNPQVDRYIKSGVSKQNYFDKSNNKRARYILERLRVRYPDIVTIRKRPVTLKWIPKSELHGEALAGAHSDHSDHSDPSGGEGSTNNETNLSVTSTIPKNENVGPERESGQNQVGVSLQERSERSERSTSASISASEYQYSCYVCIKNHRTRFETNSKSEYQSHYVQKHRKFPAYPGKADLELYGLKPQGKHWEV
jgi:MoxR-like ATPase